jgi:hypothetical protein
MPLAMEFSERCSADSEAVFGPDHPRTLARRASVANIGESRQPR